MPSASVTPPTTIDCSVLCICRRVKSPLSKLPEPVSSSILNWAWISELTSLYFSMKSSRAPLRVSVSVSLETVTVMAEAVVSFSSRVTPSITSLKVLLPRVISTPLTLNRASTPATDSPATKLSATLPPLVVTTMSVEILSMS